jgi:hypothetical protein
LLDKAALRQWESSEAFLSAYPWRYSFDATIGAREPRGKGSKDRSAKQIASANHTQGRKWYARYAASAVAIPSPAFDALKEAARTNNVFLHVGIIEKDGGTLYCTAVLFDRNGGLLYKHRKVRGLTPFWVDELPTLN